jgi:hypothetical protein
VSVTARVTLALVQQYGGNMREVTLRPVYSSDKNDPNYSYSHATPSGEIRLTITNPNAFSEFEFGKDYDVVFTEVVKDEA